MPSKFGRPKHIYVAIDQKTLHDTQLLVKETDARSRVMFAKLHNMQVEITGLKLSLDKMIALLLETLPDSASSTEAQAIIRDFLNNIKPKNQ